MACNQLHECTLALGLLRVGKKVPEWEEVDSYSEEVDSYSEEADKKPVLVGKKLELADM
jgi:hypothetical protein